MLQTKKKLKNCLENKHKISPFQLYYFADVQKI